MGTLIRFAVSTAALYVAVWLVPGLEFEGSTARFLLLGVVFGVVNALLLPLLTILTCPLLVLTLGLFTFVINALLILATGWISARWGLGFHVSGFWAALLGGIIVGITSTALTLFVGSEARK